MENINKNEHSKQDKTLSRGEFRLQKTEEFSESISQNSQSEKVTQSSYSEENSELDSVLNEATTTKAEKQQAEKLESEQVKDAKSNDELMSVKDASKLAVGALQEFCSYVNEKTGKPIQFGGAFVKLFVATTVPVIRKYSKHVSAFSPDEIDLDSYMPEILALGSFAAVGGSAYLQARKEIAVDASNKKGVGDGD